MKETVENNNKITFIFTLFAIVRVLSFMSTFFGYEKE